MQVGAIFCCKLPACVRLHYLWTRARTHTCVHASQYAYTRVHTYAHRLTELEQQHAAEIEELREFETLLVAQVLFCSSLCLPPSLPTFLPFRPSVSPSLRFSLPPSLSSSPLHSLFLFLSLPPYLSLMWQRRGRPFPPTPPTLSLSYTYRLQP